MISYMEITTVLDSITSFIMDPNHHHRKPAMQGIAWLVTIILGIGTVGIAQGLSALWRKLRHIDKNETHEKIGRLFQEVFFKNKKDHQSINLQNTSPIPNPPSTLQELARTVYENREELWNEAEREANGNGDLALICFINKIRKKFGENNKSLSEITNNSEALNIFFQDPCLRVALVNYARVNNLQALLNKHLVFVAQEIYDRRNDYAAQAVQEAHGNLSFELLNLTLTIRTIFKIEARSLKEIFKNKEALEIFKKSHRLTVVLSLYVKMKEAPPREEKEEEEAVRLARDNAQRPGLVTRIGLKKFESNEEELRKGIKKFLLLNHPDKNPDADPELVTCATQLLDMIKQGVYSEYRATLKKYRDRQNS
jgi:hypothetical protein